MKLKNKEIHGEIKVLRVVPYHDCPVYIRMIGPEIFMYDLIFKNQMYSSYIVIKPAKGKTKLTKKEIEQGMLLINAGAQATIDTLLGVKLDKEVKRMAKIIAGVN